MLKFLLFSDGLSELTAILELKVAILVLVEALVDGGHRDLAFGATADVVSALRHQKLVR